MDVRDWGRFRRIAAESRANRRNHVIFRGLGETKNGGELLTGEHCRIRCGVLR